MSHHYSMRIASLSGLIAAILVTIGVVDAAEDKPSPRGAPGILVEPSRPRDDGDADRRDQPAPKDGQRRDSERPGCPVNDRPLELLV